MNKPRLITTHEGRFINLDDIKAALNDEQFMVECVAMLKVGRDQNQSAGRCMAHAIGYCITVLTGDVERMPEGTVKVNPQKEYYSKVFNVLVDLGGAPESMREDFCTSDHPPDEYRFQGKLGFGGKYWRHNHVVSCYVEHETVVTRKLIQDINEALVKIPKPAA